MSSQSLGLLLGFCVSAGTDRQDRPAGGVGSLLGTDPGPTGLPGTKASSVVKETTKLCLSLRFDSWLGSALNSLPESCCEKELKRVCQEGP